MEVADLAAAAADINDVEVLGKTYWPASLQAYDFRDHQGIMDCGKEVARRALYPQMAVWCILESRKHHLSIRIALSLFPYLLSKRLDHWYCFTLGNGCC